MMDATWAAALDRLVEQALAQEDPDHDLINACLDHAERADPTDDDTVLYGCDRMLRLARYLAHRYGTEVIEPAIVVAMNTSLSAYVMTGDPMPVLRFANELTGQGLHNFAITLLDHAVRLDAPAAPAGAPTSQARLHALRGELLRRKHALDAAEVSLTAALGDLVGTDIEVERQRTAVLNSLGLLRHDRGDLAEARKYLIEALEIGERVGRSPLETAVTLDNLGTVEAALANAAGPLRLRAGDVNSVVADHLRDADHYHARAGKIFETALPDSAEDYVISLINRVDVAHQLGEHDREDELGLRAIEMLDQGEISSGTIMFVVSVRSQVLNRHGRYREAIDVITPWLADWAAAAPQDRPIPGLIALMTAAVFEGDHVLAAHAGAGLVATDDALLARRLAGASEPAADRIFAEYIQHAELVIGHCLPPEPTGVTPAWLYEVLLNRKGVQAERELGGEWLTPVTVEDVQARLSEQTTLLDLAMVRRPTEDREYVLFIVPAHGDIRYRRLGLVREIDEQLQRLISGSPAPLAHQQDRQPTVPLAIVGQVDPLTRELVLAPTGLWDAVPVRFLTDADGVPLIDNHVLSLVPSGRWLAGKTGRVPGRDRRHRGRE